MINNIIPYVIRFVVLVLLQALIFNNIELGGHVNPYFYIYFILSLPFDTRNSVLLTTAFLLGLTMDMFCSTMGMHTSACVFMAFCRPFALKFFSPRDGYEKGNSPSIDYLGFTWYFSYSAALIFAHHFALFYLEVFRFSEFFDTFTKTILSSLLTLAMAILIQYLFSRKRNRL
jgi:rod shape-determining protein MreD